MSKSRRYSRPATIVSDFGVVVLNENGRRMGHMAHDLGCGAHDPRARRCRTRQGQTRRWQKEQA